MSETPSPRNARLIAGLVTGMVVALGLAAFLVGINAVAGPHSPAGIVPTDCPAAQFGTPLAPHDLPPDRHVYPHAPKMQIDTTRLYQATITTAKGTIVLCLKPSEAPVTVNNYVVLARNHFFDGLVFHRVVPNFVIQGGDPKSDGTGGPGFTFSDELPQGKYADGSLAMANSGPNTNGSQFFICIGTGCDTLPAKYNLFGYVQGGLDVAKKIQQGDVMQKVTVAEQVI